MNGPAFLKLPSHLWPRTIEDTTPSTLDNMPTTKTNDIQTYSLICNTPHTFVDYKQFSSWKRLLRTTFYILKTMDLVKRRLSTVKERYQRSKDILFRVAQNESFPEDIKDIQRTQTVKARSKIVNFNPYLDQEGIMKSRPLTKTSADSNDIACLTPNHFIIPRRINFPTTTLEANKHTGRLVQLNRQCESNANQFWTRLMKEYLPTLRPQSKWHTTKDPIMEGQVVWILENNSPRGLWPLGLVTEVYPGSDNIVRKCKLKTKTGETVKSAHQLCPLECNGNL